MPTPVRVQNCTVVPAIVNPSVCVKGSRVQAVRLPRASNLQLRSLIALLTACEPPKVAGTTAGTPPSWLDAGPASHMSTLPLPSARDVTIWKCGRIFGLLGWELNVTVPTGRRLSPGMASR